MLSKDRKKELISELAENVKNSQTIAVFDYKGLSVAEFSELRDKIRENGADIKVIKKSLADIALEKVGIELHTREMEGQTAVVFGGENEISVPKAIVQFANGKQEPGRILGGALEGVVISDKKIIELSKLPTREELLGKLVGTIQGPISGFVGALSGNLRNIVGVLDAVKKAKE